MPRISPDGKRLAYIAPDEEVLNVWVKTIGSNDDKPITRDRGRGIRGYFWARNNEQIVYVQDKDGDENWHIYLISADGGEAIDLTPETGIQARIVAVNRNFPDVILIGINNRQPQLHDVYRVNLKTGEKTLEVQNDIGVVHWIADRNLTVRIGQVPTPDGGFMLLHRSGNGGDWEKLMSWGTEDALSTGAVSFTRDNKTLYMVNSVNSNAAQMRTIDVETGAETVVAYDETYDVSDIIIHPITYQLQAVAFTKERTHWHLLDESIEDDFDALTNLHRGDFEVVDRDDADNTWVVAYVQDIGPVVYYTYDRIKKEGKFLLSTRPKLDEWKLAEMKPVKYTARDGMVINGYLTLPLGVEPKNLAAILYIHGGPWVRDTWGYEPLAQWLANRGYAVLQVNYRGSTGYGKEFTNAGDKEWGGRMQDDITDGAEWLVGEGIADPQRLGIYGGSYGGFAVLSALTKTPTLFKCGVDIVGPSNLITFQNTIPPYWEPVRPLMYKRIGHPEDDRELLEERSPLNHIDKIVSPLMIVQGANDPRVKRSESIQIRDALQNTGKKVEYMEFSDEGHGIVRPESQLKYYAASEKFLADNLGGRFEPE